MLRITRIGVGSAFRVGAVLSAISSVVLGLLLVLLQLGVLGLLVSGYSQSSVGSYSGGGSMSGLGAFSALTGGTVVCVYLVGIVVSALMGGCIGAALALFYNWTVKLIGGIEVEVSGLGAAPLSERDALAEEIQRDLSYHR